MRADLDPDERTGLQFFPGTESTYWQVCSLFTSRACLQPWPVNARAVRPYITNWGLSSQDKTASTMSFQPAKLLFCFLLSLMFELSESWVNPSSGCWATMKGFPCQEYWSGFKALRHCLLCLHWWWNSARFLKTGSIPVLTRTYLCNEVFKKSHFSPDVSSPHRSLQMWEDSCDGEAGCLHPKNWTGVVMQAEIQIHV